MNIENRCKTDLSQYCTTIFTFQSYNLLHLIFFILPTCLVQNIYLLCSKKCILYTGNFYGLKSGHLLTPITTKVMCLSSNLQDLRMGPDLGPEWLHTKGSQEEVARVGWYPYKKMKSAHRDKLRGSMWKTRGRRPPSPIQGERPAADPSLAVLGSNQPFRQADCQPSAPRTLTPDTAAVQATHSCGILV